MKKKIKILTPGIINAKGFIVGPVITPYIEECEMIFKMISTGVNVVEVLDNGSEITLNVSNFDTDNNKKGSTKAPKKVTAPVEELVDTSDVTTTESVVIGADEIVPGTIETDVEFTPNPTAEDVLVEGVEDKIVEEEVVETETVEQTATVNNNNKNYNNNKKNKNRK